MNTLTAIDRKSLLFFINLKMIRSLLLLSFFLPLFAFGIPKDEFVNWWTQYRESPKIPLDLKIMVNHFVQSGLIEYSSNYWNQLNKTNIEQITNYGYENFKQTVTKNYFTWTVSVDHPYAKNLKLLAPKLSIDIPKEELEKVHPLFTPRESLLYNEITLHFLNYMLSIGAGSQLETLEEPLIGNPPCLSYQGRRISQDIFNSLLEYLPINAHCPIQNISTIIEVGAGSGRTAFCFISLHPGIKYVIVDFPPALYISQKYLSEVFPEKKVMHFRPFEKYEEISDEYSQADVVFLTPDQLKNLPNKSSDLFLAIDCLHEMKPDIIAYYFKEADRLSSYMYFKCWQKTLVPYDNLDYSSESYPVPSSWRLLFKQPCVVPSDFFHAFYIIPGSTQGFSKETSFKKYAVLCLCKTITTSP